MKKLFSVIISTYNREEYVRQAIDSVLAQTFSEYEVIVVDDGSTDRTQEVLKSYGARIKTIFQENQGSEVAYKTGASVAKGEYLAFLDSDDLFLSCALYTYNKIIETSDLPPLIIGSVSIFKEGQRVDTNRGNVGTIEALKYRDYLSKDVSIGLAQSRIVMPKALFDEVQAKTGKPVARNMNDYRMILRAATYSPCVIIRRPDTVAYRQHDGQSSKKVKKMSQAALNLIQIVKRGECPDGQTRRFIRYAFIGGPIYEWTRKALRSHLPGLAFRLIINGGPMVAAAVLRKLWCTYCKTSTTVIIKDQ